jgi:hypothetical protein
MMTRARRQAQAHWREALGSKCRKEEQRESLEKRGNAPMQSNSNSNDNAEQLYTGNCNQETIAALCCTLLSCDAKVALCTRTGGRTGGLAEGEKGGCVGVSRRGWWRFCFCGGGDGMETGTTGAGLGTGIGALGEVARGGGDGWAHKEAAGWAGLAWGLRLAGGLRAVQCRCRCRCMCGGLGEWGTELAAVAGLHSPGELRAAGLMVAPPPAPLERDAYMTGTVQ